MEQKHCTAYSSSSRLPAREDNPQFNLQDWDSKARKISGQNTNSRRFSASNITALREDTCRSFRFNITISSTASPPGYPLKEEIDPSTYSFTTALKALQAKAARNNQDCLSPEGFALNSKWNDAEKYICNPLSGQVPIECLSARSFRNYQSRITVSAPLLYSAKTRVAQTKAPLTARESPLPAAIGEKKGVGMTRDVGIQSAEAEINDSSSSSSSSPCPASTPSIGERMSKRLGTEGGESPNSSSKQKSEEEDVEVNKGRGGGGGGGGEEEQVEEEEGKEESCEGDQNINNGESDGIGALWYDDDHEKESRRSRQPAGGWCLSWMRSRKRDKLRSHKTKKPFFVPCTVAKRGGAIGNR